MAGYRAVSVQELTRSSRAVFEEPRNGTPVFLLRTSRFAADRATMPEGQTPRPESPKAEAGPSHLGDPVPASSALQPLVSRTEAYVRPYMAKYRDISHDWSHIKRVRRSALKLASLEGLSPSEMLVVELAALLHDVGDSKFLKAGQTADVLLRGFMEKEAFPSDLQAALLWIIPRVSFTFEKKHGFPTEGPHRNALACVQDADR
jgi:hypothetical protein